MRVVKFSYDDNNLKENKNTILCLGFFDGFHLGHMKVINEAKKAGKNVSLLTLETAPMVHIKHLAKLGLMSNEDKAEYCKKLGLNTLYIMAFEEKDLSLSKEDFIHNVIQRINPKEIYCGTDYTFGAGGEGKPEYMNEFIKTTAVDLKLDNNIKISTRYLLKDVQDGNIDLVNKLLARPYEVKGVVFKGLQNGRKIGFPTANIKTKFPYAMPKDGVYKGYVKIDGNKYDSLISVSTHPTIDELDQSIIEAYILDFNQNIYKRKVTVGFNKYLREITKFSSLDDLKKQIEIDLKVFKK